MYPWRKYPCASYGVQELSPLLLLYFQFRLHMVSAICLEFSEYIHMAVVKKEFFLLRCNLPTSITDELWNQGTCGLKTIYSLL